MWPDRVSKPGPLTYESGALLTALCGLARMLSARIPKRASIKFPARQFNIYGPTENVEPFPKC